jgi:hypothetical protein
MFGTRHTDLPTSRVFIPDVNGKATGYIKHAQTQKTGLTLFLPKHAPR